ncbi:hypothetical protein BH24ACT14_BH24ACT14_17750 [soil metagenome]
MISPTASKARIVAQMRDWSGMQADSVRLLEQRTGQSLADWNRRIGETGIDSEPELRTWLAERGVTGYGQMILVMERFGYPDHFTSSADELVEGQYADRPVLRPILDRILVAAAGLDEVHVQARKTYVSLVSDRRQFAVVKPTTRDRVDLGLRLDGRQPEGRLQPARGLANDTINVRVGLRGVDEVDDEVVTWLQAAYLHNS